MANKFKVGEIVFVARRSEWGGWQKQMDVFIGGFHEIDDVGSGGNYYRIAGWWFPEESLKPAVDDMDIPGYTDSVDPEKAMQVLRSLCGKGSY